MGKYYIRRKFFNAGPWAALVERGEVIKTNLSLEDAQAHCTDPETSSTTCTTEEGLELTRKRGAWFDCYYPNAEYGKQKETMFGLGEHRGYSPSYHGSY